MDIKSIVSQDFVTVDEETPLSELIGKLKNFEKHSALVFRNKKYLGVIEKKKLLRSKIDATEAKIKKFVENSPTISETADVIETAYLLFQSNLDYVPVQKDKQIIGVVTGVALAQLAAALPEAKSWKVSDIKYVKPFKVTKNDPLSKAMEVMHDEHIDHVPIFDQGKLYGVMSYKDVVRKYLNWSPQREVSAKFNKMASSRSAETDIPRLGSLPVSSFSTNDKVLTITENKSLKEAVTIMVQHNVADLVVMQGEEFKGLLMVKNILRRIGSLKIPQNFNIQFVGMNTVGLESYQIYNIQKIASNEAFKLQRKIHNEFKLVVHIKEYEKDGTKHKYTVNLRIEYPGRIVTSSDDDWDIETALRKAFENAQNELEKMFKGNKKKSRAFE